jgi:hypothetical protein
VGVNSQQFSESTPNAYKMQVDASFHLKLIVSTAHELTQQQKRLRDSNNWEST